MSNTRPSIQIENALIPIFVLWAKLGVIPFYNFVHLAAARHVAKIGPRASLLRYLDLPLKMHYEGEKLGQNRGRGNRILTTN